MKTESNGQLSEEYVFNAAMEVLANQMGGRLEWFNRMTRSEMDPRRSIDDECGYPKRFTAHDLHDLYERDPIAARVVEVMPKECWQRTPWVYETEEDEITAFEQAWDELGSSLAPEPGFSKQEEGSLIWEYLSRADILSGIGQYGVILLGLDDGKPLHMPVDGVEEAFSEHSRTSDDNGKALPYTVNYAPRGAYKLTRNKKQRRLLYMRVLPESQAEISALESNVSSPRLGRPTMYKITLADPRAEWGAVQGNVLTTMNVHWTRVVHIADTNHSASTCDWLAKPRMKPVLNNILNLRKMYGASPEGYWKACFNLLQFTTHPELGGNVKIDRAGLRDQYENVINGLQRALVASGGEWKSIAPSVSDPSPHIQRQLEAVTIKIAVPMRIFIGSERGELASSQDDDAWNDRVKQRNAVYTTPRVVHPVCDRLIWLGCLPEPEQYYVEWPDITSENQSQKMDVAVKRVTAMAQYVGGNVSSIMAPFDFYTRVLDFTEEEAEAILEGQEEFAEEQAELQEPAMPTESGPPSPDNPDAGSSNGGNGEQGGPPNQAPAKEPVVENAFCPTGPGGGKDNSCPPSKGGSGKSEGGGKGGAKAKGGSKKSAGPKKAPKAATKAKAAAKKPATKAAAKKIKDKTAKAEFAKKLEDSYAAGMSGSKVDLAPGKPATKAPGKRAGWLKKLDYALDF
jgi:hypothetical protein